MTRLKNANMLLALFLGLAALNASAETEKTTVDSAKSAASNAGEAVDNSINKVGDFMDDSTITARVKAALIDHKDINSGDISVKTENKVVTLSGDVFRLLGEIIRELSKHLSDGLLPTTANRADTFERGHQIVRKLLVGSFACADDGAVQIGTQGGEFTSHCCGILL